MTTDKTKSFQDIEHDKAIARQREGITWEKFAMERGILDMIKGFREYCEMHKVIYGDPIGKDAYFAENAMEPMLEAFKALLNGETGRLDGATMDKMLRDLASDHDLNYPE